MATTPAKDYYKILGLNRDVDQKAVKAAFRKIARKNHPDINPNDNKAEERFKEANEANEVLSNPASRKLYDRYGDDWTRYREAGFTGDEPRGASSSPFRPGAASSRPSEQRGPSTFRMETDGGEDGLGDFMQSMFGRRGPARTVKHRGENLTVSVEISFEESFAGATRRITVKTPETCGTCHGAGVARGATCPTCDGAGTVPRAKTIEVKIPAGVKTGAKIRAAGQGAPGANGGPSGDVVLDVTVRPSERFEREGDNLRTDFDVPLYTAILGGEAPVATPTGRLALTIPPGSQNGRVFRLRNKGMPSAKADPAEYGDLLAKMRVVLPVDLSEEEQALFRRLQESRQPA